jgi:hypothetical protein
MPAGFTRFRKHQWGSQGSNSTAIDTAAVATRALPWRGVPEVNMNWTFDEVDQGSLHKITAPSQRRWDITETLTGPLSYDDVVYPLNTTLITVTTPTGGGAAKTWTFQPTSLTAPPLTFITEQFGDDVGDPAGETPADWFQLIGGLAETLTLTGNEDMGPVEISVAMRYAKAASTGSTDYPATGTVPTAGLTVEDEPFWVYMADCELFLDDTAGGIGTTKISDALHTLELTVTNNFDLKTYANGSNTRFQLRGFGRGEQEISLALQFAKTSATVGTGSEADDWMSTTAVKRFAELRFTHPAPFITGSTPYSLSIRLPVWYVTRDDGEIGGNTTVTLTGTGGYDATLGYAIRAVAVNALTAL